MSAFLKCWNCGRYPNDCRCSYLPIPKQPKIRSKMLYIVEIKRPDDKKWGLPTCHYKLKDAKEYVAQNRRSFPSTNYRISKYRKVD